MPFLISPGVSVQEIDLTGLIPAVSTTEGAMVGNFQWGPCHERVLVDSEDELIRWFWKPDDDTYIPWYTAWNFLNYGNKLYVVREVIEDSANSQEIAKNATAANSHGFLIKNKYTYDHNYADGSLDANFGCGSWVAKYPGDLGNSIRVSVCASSNAYQSNLTGTVSITANTATVTGVSTIFDNELVARDLIVINDETHMVKSIASNTSLTLYSNHVAGASANVATRRWEFYVEVDQPPTTSEVVATQSGIDDEIHVVVVDNDGRWTGTNNEILEVWQNLSLASDAKSEDGSSIYYKEKINRSSRYLWWAGHDGSLTNAGHVAKATNFGRPARPLGYSLSGGNDGGDLNPAEKILGYDLFKNPEEVDVSLVLGVDATQTVAVHLINNIAEARMDCVALLSPPRDTVVNNLDSETDDIVSYRNVLPSTSYAFMDNNWKYQYDKHNDTYRYVPMNGDIGGLMVRTDTTRDPWWSPAGLNRGQVKNVISLAWSPRQADRDILYKSGVNSVVAFPGQGTVLWGDKTLLSKPSAFDRINVRRLFIVLEKAIAIAAKFVLFEFNDAFTRSMFKNMVEPFLRDVQGRRGIYDFQVVCDETNNTAEVIDRNEFIGDIYIKPARVINFINLRFIATRTGVAFDEVIGRF